LRKLLAGAVLVASLAVPEPGPSKDGRPLPADFGRRLASQVAAVPGVARATAGELPFSGTRVAVARLDGSPVAARQVEVDGAYFATLRLPIVRGRGIDEHDHSGGDQRHGQDSKGARHP